MAERLHPGVYVEEVSGGVRPIEGVSTSTAAFIGEAARGQPARASLLTSFADYVRVHGDHQAGEAGLLAAAVDGFFSAGGRRAYVVRVLPSDAVKAQSASVATRVAQNAPAALQFVAKGAGKWADAIRINITDATSFKDDGFRVDVMSSDGGATRRLETFDDVRMDPSHEDYIGERIKTSSYVDIVDLFALAVDANPAATLVTAAAPRVTARAVPANGTYLMYEGKAITATAWDTATDAPRTTQTITFTPALLATLGANPPTFANGSVQLTPAQLATLLNSQLTSFAAPANANPPSIAVRVGTAPVAVLSPANGATWNLTNETLNVSVNGGAVVAIDVDGATPAQTTAQEIADAINGSAVGVSAVVTGTVAAPTVTVTGRGNEAAAPALTIASSPTPARVGVATTAGVQGLGPERWGGLRLTLSENITATAPALLRSLGFAASGRGYALNSPANPLVRPAATTGLRLVGGSDGASAISASDYEGDARERTGLHALDGKDINLVALPGKTDIAYLAIGGAYCDNRGDCFCLFDGPGGVDRQIEVKPDDARQFVESLPLRSKNTAMYYPWIKVPDPVGVGRNPTRFVPPSGHVAGVFARTDVTRGVWKAPAGIEASVSEAVGLQYQVIDAEQDLLNPAGLNCLRQFPGVGIVSWGTRTLASDPEWRYVPVRRMGLFLKESLRRGLKWAVFEPNDAELWGRIKINIQSFMMTLFRQGAFQGGTPEEAFAVACDRSTNPQENVDAGIVTAKVAFAPLKPAEFVVIEISQKSLLVA